MIRLMPLIVLIVLLLLPLVVSGNVSVDFENGLGLNGQLIGSSIPGFLFGSAPVGLHYADINTGLYNVSSDNGYVSWSGEYFVSGWVAAYSDDPSALARIDLTNGNASSFAVGYTSNYEFSMRAYGSNSQLLDTATGNANTLSQGGNGLQYLTITQSAYNIAYITLQANIPQGQGGSWLVDNISADLVPEPGSMLTLGVGLIGLIAHRRSLRRSHASS